ncbi:hypothetical protein [Aquimarina muelleri]|uniref:Uncharacterized protein n=1 Tax=Aquimarina muelleri TaxID=279356 RepID=A0A918JU42_9FLAO|nr:hypothetical protein [Aquimarina muelleri]MCX2763558.1 hypothetical protein [Aquimarina muelleri]GGX14373.1 hypothetical protein GCM10007384_14920 [Aquimarina muelleri]
MSKQDYDNTLTTLKAIPTENIKIPNIPIDTYLQEAENLYLWVQEDKKALLGINLDWQQYVEDITVRTAALRHAQSLWIRRKTGKEKSQLAWREKLPIAYALRNDLLADYRYAYKDNTAILLALKDIAKGKRYSDLIQDLSDLSVLGASNLPELQAINFDISVLDTAQQLSATMAKLLAEVTSSTMYENSTVLQLRNRAYTHLKEAVDQIRSAGKYVFRKDSDRYKGYISNYRK